MQDFENSIIQTLAYFDLFDHPLTKEELFRYLWNPSKGLSYEDFLDKLSDLEYVQNKQGFLFLKGREKIITERQRRVKLIEEKMKVAVCGIKKLRWIPFVRSVFACNTVASAVAEGDSDIDVFIVIKKGRMWLSRMLVTLTLSLFKLRRTKNKIKNKICLSFYVTDDNLNIEDVSIDGSDIYLVYWLSQLVPLYDRDNLFESIQKANSWIKKFTPYAFQQYDLLHRWRVEDTKLSQTVKNIFERMWGGAYGNMIEKQAKGIQL